MSADQNEKLARRFYESTVRVPFVHIWTVADNHLQRMRGFTDTAVLARALAAS
jgi:ketosteroid isomerase-like protein